MHTSGLAFLRHPVRRRADLQHGPGTSAEVGRAPLTLSDGVTVTANRATKCSAWFPPLVPPVGSALLSTGSSEASSPASAVLWRCATSCAPHAGLGCLRPAIRCVAPVVSLPAVQDAQPRAWGASLRSPLPDRCAGRQAAPPKFLENKVHRMRGSPSARNRTYPDMDALRASARLGTGVAARIEPTRWEI
jgi:hypothetical protein